MIKKIQSTFLCLVIGIISLPNLAKAEATNHSAAATSGDFYEAFFNFDDYFFDGASEQDFDGQEHLELESKYEENLPPECKTPVWAMCTIRRRRW